MSWGAQNRSEDAKTPTFAPAMSRKPKLALCGIQPHVHLCVSGPYVASQRRLSICSHWISFHRSAIFEATS
jgi:hypothetical protein